MMYDLPNNMVKIEGSERKIDFNILSESKDGCRRTLTLYGYDEMGNQFNARGHFDKIDYRLNVTFIEKVN